MIIYFGADHRGFDLKETLKKFVQDKGYEISDLGDTQKNPEDDYTDFAMAVGKKVGEDAQSRGILVCGSGAGMEITANKFKGVRATVGFLRDQVFDARNHDDINVLVLSADFVSVDDAQQMVKLFLDTPMSPEPRHARRLQKIVELENRS